MIIKEKSQLNHTFLIDDLIVFSIYRQSQPKLCYAFKRKDYLLQNAPFGKI